MFRKCHILERVPSMMVLKIKRIASSPSTSLVKGWEAESKLRKTAWKPDPTVGCQLSERDLGGMFWWKWLKSAIFVLKGNENKTCSLTDSHLITFVKYCMMCFIGKSTVLVSLLLNYFTDETIWAEIHLVFLILNLHIVWDRNRMAVLTFTQG